MMMHKTIDCNQGFWLQFFCEHFLQVAIRSRKVVGSRCCTGKMIGIVFLTRSCYTKPMIYT